jgi:hypothetical protein
LSPLVEWAVFCNLGTFDKSDERIELPTNVERLNMCMTKIWVGMRYIYERQLARSGVDAMHARWGVIPVDQAWRQPIVRVGSILQQGINETLRALGWQYVDLNRWRTRDIAAEPGTPVQRLAVWGWSWFSDSDYMPTKEGIRTDTKKILELEQSGQSVSGLMCVEAGPGFAYMCSGQSWGHRARPLYYDVNSRKVSAYRATKQLTRELEQLCTTHTVPELFLNGCEHKIFVEAPDVIQAVDLYQFSSVIRPEGVYPSSAQIAENGFSLSIGRLTRIFRP